jgi:hypothetical protein
MYYQDHLLTQSHGKQGEEGRLYRQKQAELIKAGKVKDAVMMDVNDIRATFGSKYDGAIQQMLDLVDREYGDGETK